MRQRVRGQRSAQVKFVLSININDDDGVPTCKELGGWLMKLGEGIVKKGLEIPRVVDCGEGGPALADGRRIGEWRIE